MPSRDGRSVEIVFDFVDHRLDASTSDGRHKSFQLANGLAASDFHRQLFTALDALDVAVRINPAPFDLDGPCCLTTATTTPTRLPQ